MMRKMGVRVEGLGTSIVDDAVPQEQQSMPLDNVFWSHFSRNLGPSGWVIGVLVVIIGLNFWWGLLAIIIGNILGSLPVAFCAIMGPATGLTQMEDSRFAFGRSGTRLPSWINWLCCVGWDAVNNVPSTIALVVLVSLAGVAIPFWAALAFLAALQMVASVYGHDVVQLMQKYLGYVLLLIFGITGTMAVVKGGTLVAATQPLTLGTFLLAVSLVASYNVAWAPYSADYTRYLPRSTKHSSIFALSFAGMLASGVAIELCGLLTASKIPDTSPTALIKSIVALTGNFAPFALLALAISSVATNSLNDNTASYSLISAGVKLPRYVSAIVTAVFAFILAAAGAGQFATLYSNYLVVLVYWVSPWVAIVLTDWYFLQRYKDMHYSRGWAPGATIFTVVTLLTIVLFSSTEVYVGPIAKLLGGTDIGYFVGFFVAAGLYYIVRRAEKRAAPMARTTHA